MGFGDGFAQDFGCPPEQWFFEDGASSHRIVLFFRCRGCHREKFDSEISWGGVLVFVVDDSCDRCGHTGVALLVFPSSCQPFLAAVLRFWLCVSFLHLVLLPLQSVYFRGVTRLCQEP